MAYIGFILSFREKLGRCGTRPFSRLLRIFLRHGFTVLRRPVLKVIFGITLDCQCRCGHCGMAFYGKGAAKELDGEECKRVIDDAAALPCAFVLLSFFGGEPLLRSDVHELVAYAASRGLFCEIETNGILLDEDCARRLNKSGIHHVFVSIDDTDEAAHDASRSYPGAFKCAARAIRACVKERIPCSVSVCVSGDTVDKAASFVSWAKKMRAASVRFLLPAETKDFCGCGKRGEGLGDAGKEKIKAQLTPGYAYLESTAFNRPGIRKLCPAARKWFFYVSCCGDIQACPYLPVVFGSIRSGALNEILDTMWGHALFRRFRDAECLVNDGGAREFILQPDKTGRIYSCRKDNGV